MVCRGLPGLASVIRLALFAFAAATLLGCAHQQRRPRGGESPVASAPLPRLPAPLPESRPPSPPAPPQPSPAIHTPPAPHTPPATDKAEPAPAKPQVQVESPPPTNHAADRIRQLYRQATERYAAVPGYQARLRRREQLHGKDQPEEVMLFKFRKEPFSVYFKWLGPVAKGREVVYVQGRHDDKIHTLMAAGDFPFIPAGTKKAISPDNPMALSRSRHAITESGIGAILSDFGQAVEGTATLLVSQPDGEEGGAAHWPLEYLGPQSRPEYPVPLEAVRRRLPPGRERHLPHGGERYYFFDPASQLPVLVITLDENRREVEYYCYDQLQLPVAFPDDDFDPKKLWSRR
jgi:hypothetical protein